MDYLFAIIVKIIVCRQNMPFEKQANVVFALKKPILSYNYRPASINYVWDAAKRFISGRPSIYDRNIGAK
jgi:hypothetical protein